MAGSKALIQDGRFSTKEVVELTGCTERQLDYWYHTGRVTPSTVSGRESQSGEQLRWSYGDVAYLRRVKARLAFGLTLDAAFRAADPAVLPAPADPQLRGMSKEETAALLYYGTSS